MSDTKSHLTFEAARRLANEDAAKSGLRHLAPRGAEEFLSDYYLEAEGCWYFFPADNIEVPEEAWHLRGCAFAVSKSGQRSLAYDYRDDSMKMREYLEAFSLWSLGRSDDAKAAMAAFLKKYPQP